MTLDQDEDDRLFELNSRYDYLREAYGDPCPCGTLRWGGDCPKCYTEEEDPMQFRACSHSYCTQPAQEGSDRCAGHVVTPGATLITPTGLSSDPTGAQATFTLEERSYLVDVVAVHRAINGRWMVQTRHFNGEAGPTVPLAIVSLLHRR